MYEVTQCFNRALAMGLSYLTAYAFTVAFVIEYRGYADKYARKFVSDSLTEMDMQIKRDREMALFVTNTI